jgi:glycopeptide antibiotics resistance protein
VRSRHLLVLLLVGYVVFLGWLLLNPSAAAPSATVRHVAAALRGLGLPPGLVSNGRVEFGLNAAMFAPLTMLTVLIWPRFAWTHWVAWAFVLSSAVEVCQALALPERSAQFVDVVANTLGALAGAWLMGLVRRRRRAGHGDSVSDATSVSPR